MNSIDFNKNNFPITANVLGHMQTNSALIEKLTGLVGGNFILTGCVTQGGSVSSGYVVVNGEIMPFSGGAIQTYVRVQSVNITVTVNDATYTRTEKNLFFGVGAGQIEWSTFRRATDLLTMIENRALLGQYITPGSGDTIDYLSTLGPGGTQQIDFSEFIPVTARFAVITIEYYWGYSTDYSDIKFRATENEANSNNIVLRAINGIDNKKWDSIIVPCLEGIFYIEYQSYLRFKMTLIGYQ